MRKSHRRKAKRKARLKSFETIRWGHYNRFWKDINKVSKLNLLFTDIWEMQALARWKREGRLTKDGMLKLKCSK